MKITFILLLATGKHIYNATTILIPSIFSFFNHEDIDKFLIIIKNKDYSIFSKRFFILKKRINIDKLKIKIIKENDIMNTSDISKTYYLQMYLKLIISKSIETKYYLTLDSDIFFTKKCNSSYFVSENKAHFQKYISYDNWTKRSMSFLGIVNKADYGVNQTPFVFKTDLVKKMLNEINVFDAILNKNCSEYTLYHYYLLKNNLFYQNYKEFNLMGKTISFPMNKIGIENLQKLLIMYFNQDKYKINVIQSRLNIHNHFTKILKKYIPNCLFEKKKIAMITIINNKIYYERYKNAIKIKKEYCKYHNYDFIFKNYNEINDDLKKNGWGKLLLLYQYLKNYDYVFVSDADVVLTNRDIRLEDIIFKYENKESKVFITTDYNSLNSGNMIWKNTNKSFQILDEIFKIGEDKQRYEIKEPFVPKGIYEQPSIIHLYNVNDELRKYINIIPQYEINSYSKILPQLKKPNIKPQIHGFVNRCNWTNGDFLVHFAGLNYLQNNQFIIEIDSAIDQYVNRYYHNIKIKEGDDFNKIK